MSQKEALLSATAIFNLSASSLDKYHTEGEGKRACRESSKDCD